MTSQSDFTQNYERHSKVP